MGTKIDGRAHLAALSHLLKDGKQVEEIMEETGGPHLLTLPTAREETGCIQQHTGPWSPPQVILRTFHPRFRSSEFLGYSGSIFPLLMIRWPLEGIRRSDLGEEFQDNPGSKGDYHGDRGGEHVGLVGEV